MSSLYDSAREGFLSKQISWPSDEFRLVLIDVTKYTVDLAAHKFLSDIPTAAQVSTSTALASKTTTAGVAGAAPPSFSDATGAAVAAFVCFRNTGTPATSDLICYEDSATGLPITPNHNSITALIPLTGNKLFKL